VTSRRKPLDLKQADKITLNISDEGQARKQRWNPRRVMEVVLLGIGKYCYGYISPFFGPDFSWAWVSAAFYWLGALTLTNFMQYYYMVCRLSSLCQACSLMFQCPLSPAGCIQPSLPILWHIQHSRCYLR